MPYGGQRISDQEIFNRVFDATNSALKTYDHFVAQAVDVDNNVIAIQRLPLAVSTYAWSTDVSAALEASTVTKASAGVLRSATVRIDSTGATDDYYIQFLNAASLPADGVVTFLVLPFKVQHITGTDSIFSFDFTSEGIFASTGIVMCASTTEFTKTIAGAILSSTIFYK